MPQAVLVPLIITAAGTGLQLLMRPRVPKQHTDKGKFDDVRVQGSDYGAIIPRIWGKGRVAGNVTFSNGVQTFTTTTNLGGGKKGGGGTETTYTYTTSAGILVCRGPIISFDKVWADAKVIYSGGIDPNADTVYEAEDGTLSGTAVVQADTDASGDAYVNGLATGEVAFDTSAMSAASLDDGGDGTITKSTLSVYYRCSTDQTLTLTYDVGLGTTTTTILCPASEMFTGVTKTINGGLGSFSLGGADVDLDAVAVSIFELPRNSPTYLAPISGAVNPNIAYPKDLDNPFAYYNYKPTAVDGKVETNTSVPTEIRRFYLGTETQLQDSAIEAWLDERYGSGQGVLRTSAMRALAYVMFQDRTLVDGRLENFTFELTGPDASLNNILEDIFADVNLTSGYYDLSATSDTTEYTQLGFLESQGSSRRSLVEYLMRYHLCHLAEIDGKIYTVPDGYGVDGTIAQSQMRAHMYGEEMPAFDCEVTFREEQLMPKEVRVSVMNPQLDFHNETQSAQLFTTIATETKEYTFPIVDTPSRPKNRAERLLLKEHVEDRDITFFGMPDTAKYAIGDTLRVTVNGVLTSVRIEKKTMRLPVGPIKFDCVKTGYIYSGAVFNDQVSSTVALASQLKARQSFPRNSVVFPIQSIPIHDKDKGRLGVYLGIAGRGVGSGVAATLYRETSENNFSPVEIIKNFTALGITDGALSTVADPNVEDTTNTIDIWFFDDQNPETVTIDDIDRDPTCNLLRIGDEWVQVRTWTEQTLEDNSPYRSKWRASNLTRGRFSTPVDTHIDGEYAAFAPFYFYDLDVSDIGQEVTLKAVTDGQDIDVAPESSFTFDPPYKYTGPLRAVFDHVVDKTTAGTSEETLYSDDIVLDANGDKVLVEYAGIITNPANDKFLKVKFGSETIINKEVTEDTGDWKIDLTLQRVSPTSLRYSVQLQTGTTRFDPDFGEITGLDHTFGAISLLSTTGSAAGDVTAKMAHCVYVPSGSQWLLDEDGEILVDENGDELI